MTIEDAFIASAINAWKTNVERAGTIFSGLSADQLIAPIAPGRNRQIYLWGHLIAVHDRMLPLLGLGPRMHPELDAAFISERDGAVADLPPAADLQRWWDEVNRRLLEGFGSFSPADWVGPHTAVSPADFAANPLRNRLSVLLSRTNHVAYHVGQSVLAPR